MSVRLNSTPSFPADNPIWKSGTFAWVYMAEVGYLEVALGATLGVEYGRGEAEHTGALRRVAQVEAAHDLRERVRLDGVVTLVKDQQVHLYTNNRNLSVCSEMEGYKSKKLKS